MSPITGSQIRAARALIRWRAEDLANHSKIGVATVRRAEGFDGPVNLTAANEAAIRAALELAGIVFIESDDTGPGVRLSKPFSVTD